MKPDFCAVAARMLLAIARGWLWLGERMRAPGDRPFAYQFFLGLLGLSISMAEIDFVPAFGARHRTKNRSLDSPAPDLIERTGYDAQRVPRTRHGGSANARPRDPDSRPHRRSAFRAENPQRIRRLR
jgi:hypothetical protein